MTGPIERLKEELSILSPIERNDILCFLIDSFGREDEDVAAEEWNAELGRRAKEILDGTAEGIPADQVFAEFRAAESRQ
jgi:putative addiction module component (TIGR02574 family)